VVCSLEPSGFLAGYLLLGRIIRSGRIIRPTGWPDYPAWPKFWKRIEVVCSLVPQRIIGRIIQLRPDYPARPDYPPPKMAGLSGLSDSNGSIFGKGINTPSDLGFQLLVPFRNS